MEVQSTQMVKVESASVIIRVKGILAHRYTNKKMQASRPDFDPLLNNNNLFNKDENIKWGNSGDVFALFGDEEFEDAICASDESNRSYCSDESTQLVDDRWKTCQTCNIHMQPMENSYQCMGCGRNTEVLIPGGGFSMSISDNYNTNTVSPHTIKIVGPGSYKYNRALFTLSDYSKTQENNNNKQLSRCNAQSTGGKLPIVILKEAAALYGKIQKEKIVRRGNGRKGALGACISFVCKAHNITKKPKEIAEFLGIDEQYLSKGDKLLRRLHAMKAIIIPVHHDPTSAYIRQYFESIGIDDKYKPFITDLIDRSSQVDMMGENNGRISTKCAGAIYALNVQMALKFTQQDIIKYCKISKSTFIRYYDFLIQNRRMLNAIFLKHGIPPLTRPVAKRAGKNVLNMKTTHPKY